MGSNRGAPSLIPLWGAWVFLALGVSSCFDIEYRGRIYSGGYVRAEAVFILPSLEEEAVSQELFGGEVRSFSEFLEKGGVRFVKDQTRKNNFLLETDRLSRLSLPWLALTYSETPSGAFTYAHGISFPSTIVTRMKRELAQRLRTLHSPDRDPEAVARGLLDTGKVVLRWTFPGPITETNGVRIDHRTVQWEFRAGDLEEGPKVGYALGRASFFRRIWDRIVLFFLRIFSPIRGS